MEFAGELPGYSIRLTENDQNVVCTEYLQGCQLATISSCRTEEYLQMNNVIDIATIAFALIFYASLIVKQHIAYRVAE